MKYAVYRLEFPNGVHLGTTSLDESNYSFSADTLFSALYLEAVRQSREMAEELLQLTMDGRLLFSDAFPWIGETCYIPKPMKSVERIDNHGDSTVKKAFKNLKYIPMDMIDIYFSGAMDDIDEQERFKSLGKRTVRTSAYVYTRDDTEPFHVGVFYFSNNSGLYILVGYDTESVHQLFYELLEALSFSGIGGKKSSGLGRFTILKESSLIIPEKKEEDSWMTLSISLPCEDELDRALEGARYRIIKKSGFVYSENYADEPQKKRELYMFEAGSCFQHLFSGDIYDVSAGGRHPVYRYAKPLFWPV